MTGNPAVEREPQVWVYGWGVQATQGLLKLLDQAIREQVDALPWEWRRAG
ncbi:hypothetical protein [Archangium violaceum]|nr:hypothetical protein [Archangium violaceum]